jgi:hypothetical protein
VDVADAGDPGHNAAAVGVAQAPLDAVSLKQVGADLVVLPVFPAHVLKRRLMDILNRHDGHILSSLSFQYTGNEGECQAIFCKKCNFYSPFLQNARNYWGKRGEFATFFATVILFAFIVYSPFGAHIHSSGKDVIPDE